MVEGFRKSMSQFGEKKVSELRDLEPDEDLLKRGDIWDSGTSLSLRRDIAFAAVLRTVGEDWGVIARVLGYDSGLEVRAAVIDGHAGEWDKVTTEAHSAVIRRKLPKEALQGLLKAIRVFTDEEYGHGNLDRVGYKDAGDLMVKASNAAARIMKEMQDGGGGDDAEDDVLDNNISNITKELEKMKE